MSSITQSESNYSYLSDWSVQTPELVLNIFSYLDTADLGRIQKVNTTWQGLAKDKSLWNSPAPIPKMAIGRAKYQEVLGVDVGDEPVLSHKQIKKIIIDSNGFKNKTLVLIPGTMNGKAVSLNEFERVVNDKYKDKKLFQYIYPPIKYQYGSMEVGNSYWVLVSKGFDDETRSKDYVKQKKIVREKLGKEFQPLTLGEASISTYMQYLVFDENVLPIGIGDKYSWTRCQEKIERYHQEKIERYQVCCGLAAGGLCVDYSCFDYYSIGLSGRRKF